MNKIVKIEKPKAEEWDLPSDADMLNWIEDKGVSITSIMLLGIPYWEISGCEPATQKNIQLATGLTLRQAIESAMGYDPKI